MSCALLENAKAQYNPYRTLKQPLACVSVSTKNISTQYPVGETTSLRFAVRRPPPKHVEFSELPAKKLLTVASQQQLKTIITSAASNIAEATGNVKNIINSSSNQQGQIQTSGSLTVSAAPVRKHIFWNTAHISGTTKFVLDVQANQAFGFGMDGKERLASKHPELIRYLPDNEDRDWLSSQNVISPHNRNSRFLFLIYEEVCRLQQTHELYRTKTNIDISIMNTFTVPEFMIQKMKLFFVDLNIKSRGLIANSFSVAAGTQGNSHLRNALLQGIAAQNNNSGGHSATIKTISSSSTVSTALPINTFIKNNKNTANVGSSNIATSSSDSNPLAKPSTLSSSHATLTALLNNSSNPPSQDKNIVANKLK